MCLALATALLHLAQPAVAQTTTTSAAVTTTTQRQVSVDGSCGPEKNNIACPADKPCCSIFGWCGNTSDFCNWDVCLYNCPPTTPTTPTTPSPYSVDGTCGPATNNISCPPDKPCCSIHGFCGNTVDFCSWDNCLYNCPPTSPTTPTTPSPYSVDGSCGPSKNNISCPPDKPCCSIHGWCGNTSTFCAWDNCLYGCPPTTPTTPTTPSPYSVDGRCGRNNSNLLCPPAYPCCSAFGWCGNSTTYCGTGCQSGCRTNGTTTATTATTAATTTTGQATTLDPNSTTTTAAPVMNTTNQPTANMTTCGLFFGGSLCPNPTDCCSFDGYCGNGDTFCGPGCQSGACQTIANASDPKATNPPSSSSSSAPSSTIGIIVGVAGACAILVIFATVVYVRRRRAAGNPTANRSAASGAPTGAVRDLHGGRSGNRPASACIEESA